MGALKIAIFEDESLLANDLKRQLEQYGYEVVAIFRKAEDGLGYFASKAGTEEIPGLVMMDITLAGKMTGLEAAQIVESQYNAAVIFLTGMNQMEVFEEAFRTKPHAFLIKPFDIQQALVSVKLATYLKDLEAKLAAFRDGQMEKIS